MIGAMAALAVVVVMAVVPWACTAGKERDDVKSQLVGVWKEYSNPRRTVFKADGRFEHRVGGGSGHVLMMEGTWRVVDGEKVELTIEANHMKPNQADSRNAEVGAKYEWPIKTLTATTLELGPFSYLRETPGKEAGTFFMAGEVNRPGAYAIEAGGTLTLKQGLAAAGWVLNKEKEQVVRVWRRDEKDRISVLEWKLAEILAGEEKVVVNDVVIVMEAGMLGKVQPGAKEIIQATQQGNGEVYVMGKVARPGVYAVLSFREYTVLQMVVSANLALEDEEIEHATVELTRRVGEAQTETVAIKLARLLDGSEADRFVQRNDMLNVLTRADLAAKAAKASEKPQLAIIEAPEAGEPGEFYMMGDVKRPGVYQLSEGRRVTVKQAVAAAGGWEEGGDKPAIAELIRREERLKLDISKIFDGDEADRFLQRNDILNVKITATTPEAWMKTKGGNINEINAKIGEFGETLMHHAAKEGRVDVLAWLKERGASVNAKGEFGETPMHRAAAEGQVEVMKWLEEQGAEVNVKDKGDSTPMHSAALRGRVEAMKWLKEQGVDANAKESGGRTPMHFAALNSYLDAMKWLREQGADVNVNSQVEGTPMHMAARTLQRHVEAMQWLKEQGADVNAKDKMMGRTPMHIAAQAGKIEAMQWLKEQGADINAKDNRGDTPLSLADTDEAKAWLRANGVE